MTKYHQDHKEDPAYLRTEALQYDMLYGKEYIYGGINPYDPANMKMGVRDIKVERVVEIGKNTISKDRTHSVQQDLHRRRGS